MARRRKVSVNKIRSRTRDTRRGTKTKAKVTNYEVSKRKKRRRLRRKKR